MIIEWLKGNKKGHAIMGVAFREVIGKGYWVKVTAYGHKVDKKEVGRICFVSKEQVITRDKAQSELASRVNSHAPEPTDSWFNIEAQDFTASVDRKTNVVSYQDKFVKPDEAKQLFIKYQSLHVQYQERADEYRRVTGKDVRVYSDCVARVALRKANEHRLIAEGAL